LFLEIKQLLHRLARWGNQQGPKVVPHLVKKNWERLW